ncbi:CvfB family protein [Desulfocicer vacuolatum]|nr:S1-like domain-containing RNA-binding protein [Desulfocicer vacuolatum]
MLIIGSYNDLVVEREVSFGFYLNPKEDEVLLPGKYAPSGLKPGDTITVFVYTDSEDRPIATTLTPRAVVGEFACMTVVDTTSFGAFLDWGLEKHLLVPADEMSPRLRKGERHVVKVCLDPETQRVYATARIEQNLSKYKAGISRGDGVDLLIYRITDMGYQAIINNSHSGMLYKADTIPPLTVGDKTKGFIHKIREDGKIDLVLKQPGYASVSGSSDIVLDILEKAGGFLPCHDKTNPEIIRKTFAMSKKEFKRSISRLYREREITISSTGITRKYSDAQDEADHSPISPD